MSLTEQQARRLVRCGVAMFLLYIATDVVASFAYADYRYRDFTISELSATGAPTRPFWLVISMVYQVMYVAYAIGVLALAKRRRAVRVVGALLLVNAIVGPLWWIAPMHQREVLAAGGGTWQDTMHLVLGGINSVLYFAMIGIGAFAFARRFRRYSIATIVVMVVFGILMNLDVQAVARNEPTPWLGIWERLAVEGAMLWQAVFAIALLRDEHRRITAA